ncbi:MAG: PepSY domain-containing protein [Burkholderiales bacterium]|nr:PepSY domain-containing protein [Burkholderiales bacterium]
MFPALVIAAGVVTAAGLAYAKESGGSENEATADLAKAKISLSQAVATAESRAGGKATRAELENENGVAVFGVEVVTPDSTVMDVKVDAADGKVLSSVADTADRGGKEANEANEGDEEND